MYEFLLVILHLKANSIFKNAKWEHTFVFSIDKVRWVFESQFSLFAHFCFSFFPDVCFSCCSRFLSTTFQSWFGWTDWTQLEVNRRFLDAHVQNYLCFADNCFSRLCFPDPVNLEIRAVDLTQEWHPLWGKTLQGSWNSSKVKSFDVTG